MRRLLSSLLLCIALPAGAQEFTTYKGHGGPIMALDVSPDGQLASASFDNSVGLWPGPAWLEGHDAAVTALTYAAPVVMSGGDDFRVLMWRSDIPEPYEVTRMKGKISAIAIAPDERSLAVASWDGSIRMMRLFSSLHSPGAAPSVKIGGDLLDHRSNVTDVAFARDGMLYSASSDGTVRVWNGDGSRVIANQGFGINQIIVHDNWLAYGAVDGTTRVIDRETGEEIADFTLDRRPILSMDYHAPTRQLAIGDGEGHIMMVDTETWTISRDFRAMRQGPVWALAFSNDGTVIHAGGIDDVIYAWPVALLDTYDPAGGDTRSFLRDAETHGKGVAVLARTSNPGSADFQARDLEGAPLYARIVEALGPAIERLTGPSGWSGLMLVAGATGPDEAAHLRALAPKSLFLVPG